MAELSLYSSRCGTLARRGLREVQRLGWVLLLQPRPGLFAQVIVQERDKDYVVTRVSTGASASAIKRAVDRARANPKGNRRTDSELRALMIPALHVMALWAHRRKNPKNDFFIPVTANFAGLRRGRSYNRAKAESLLAKRATEMILNWYERAQNEAEKRRQARPDHTS